MEALKWQNVRKCFFDKETVKWLLNLQCRHFSEDDDKDIVAMENLVEMEKNDH